MQPKKKMLRFFSFYKPLRSEGRLWHGHTWSLLGKQPTPCTERPWAGHWDWIASQLWPHLESPFRPSRWHWLGWHWELLWGGPVCVRKRWKEERKKKWVDEVKDDITGEAKLTVAPSSNQHMLLSNRYPSLTRELWLGWMTKLVWKLIGMTPCLLFCCCEWEPKKKVEQRS